MLVNVAIGAVVVLVFAFVAHTARRPQPLQLTGSSFYWSVSVTVQPGTTANQALVSLQPLYHGTGTANHVHWQLVDGRGRVLDSGGDNGPVPKGTSLSLQRFLVDSPPPNWAGTMFNITWLEIKPTNPGGQGVTEAIPVGPNGATT